LSIERTASGDLLRRRWLNATLRRKNLPDPVTLSLLAIALCVFSFCFILLSLFRHCNPSILQVLYQRRRVAFFTSCPLSGHKYIIDTMNYAIPIRSQSTTLPFSSSTPDVLREVVLVGHSPAPTPLLSFDWEGQGKPLKPFSARTAKL